MEYRRLGRTGLKVSEICLGTMTFGHGTDIPEADRIVGTSMDAGVTFFDTADGYSDGVSETMLGQALGARRREAVIATKVFAPMGPGPNDSGMSRVHIMSAVEDSLRRLGTDYIDLYYIHHVDIQTPLEEMLRAFDDLVRQGKVRYTACSNYEAWRLMEALWISDSKGLARFSAYQPQYSLVVRDIEEELVPACALKGLGMVVWSPLGRRLSDRQIPPWRTSRRRVAFGRKLGLSHPVFPPGTRGDPDRTTVRRKRPGMQSRPGRGALGTRTAPCRQRHHRSPYRRSTDRHARRRQLAIARGSTTKTRQGVGPATPLSPCHGRNDGATARSGGANARSFAVERFQTAWNRYV